jgi:hypothetical protein
VSLHFLDSGAYSIRMDANKWAQKTGNSWIEYYKTDEFKQYQIEYAAFVKRYQKDVDLCANLDVLGFGSPRDAEKVAELSFKNLNILVKLGIKPVPVVHYPESIKWIQRYLDLGYDLIGLGGLAGAKRMQSSVREGSTGIQVWVAKVFDFICDTPNRLPKAKIHGFGVTTPRMIFRYSWWSVDSSAWAKRSAYGFIYIPHRRGRKYVFDDLQYEPYTVHIACERPSTKRTNRKMPRPWKPPGSYRDHFLAFSPGERKVIETWLDHIGVPLGKVDNGVKVEEGVMSSKYMRDQANLMFFLELEKNGRQWPWPFKADSRGKGFTL